MSSTRVSFEPPPRSSPAKRARADRPLASIGNEASSPRTSQTIAPRVDEAMEEDEKPVLHVEVRLKEDSLVRVGLIQTVVRQMIESRYSTLMPDAPLPTADWAEYDLLSQHVDRIFVAEASMSISDVVQLSDYDLVVHIYQPAPLDTPCEEFNAAPPASQVSQAGGIDSGEQEEETDVSAASVLDLPSATIEGQWENLIYEGNIKTAMLNYIYTTILLSDSCVDLNLISWHRVVLLHGPPGTGKSSLAKALAQKLSIRLSDRFSRTRLVEINAHSLFSRWFSESGKLVQRLFARINQLCVEEDDDGELAFVVVLIDEVESLTAARAGAMSGKEPSDALRVVNALLTQLDRLKLRRNVLVLTTSNLPSAIDNAFVDRADVKYLIPLPPPHAIYAILRSCLLELMRVRLVQLTTVPDWTELSYETTDGGARLRTLAEQCHAVGMSGRSLRRLPVLAHARHLGNGARLGGCVKLDRWLEAMAATIEEEAVQLSHIE